MAIEWLRMVPNDQQLGEVPMAPLVWVTGDSGIKCVCPIVFDVINSCLVASMFEFVVLIVFKLFNRVPSERAIS